VTSGNDHPDDELDELARISKTDKQQAAAYW
jgi:hypothetical protein